MAYIFGDSFDLYTSTINNQGQLTAYGGWNNFSGNLHTGNWLTRFGVGKALSFDWVAYITKTLGTNTTNTVYMSLSFYLNIAQSSGEQFFRFEFCQGDYQFTIGLNRDGTIQIYRGNGFGGGTLIATFNNVFQGYMWYHFQFKVVIDSVNGSVALRVNGDTNDTYSATGLNTKNTANAYVSSVNLISTQYWNQSIWFDDFLINDSSGTVLNTYPGDIRCYALSPTGAGDSSDFTPTPTQANYLNVNETDPNLTNYNSANVVGNTDLFAMADLPTAPANIYAVVARCVANKADAGSRSGSVVIKSGTTVSPGPNKVLLTSYAGIIQPYSTNPDTGLPWTFTTVNSLQAGYKVSG